MRQIFLILVLFFLTAALANAQSVSNIRFEQSGRQVVIYYDLSGERGTAWNIEIYCSQDGGISWGAPLQKLIGEFGNAIKPGTNKKVTWDVLAETEKLEGKISFKVVATGKDGSGTYQSKVKRNYSADYYKYKKGKSFWFVSCLATGAIGTYSYLQAAKYNTQYKDATTDAAAIHQKVVQFDIISLAAFGAAGFCAAEFIIKAGKQGKAKGQSVSFYPQPLKQGGGLALVCKF